MTCYPVLACCCISPAVKLFAIVTFFALIFHYSNCAVCAQPALFQFERGVAGPLLPLRLATAATVGFFKQQLLIVAALDLRAGPSAVTSAADKRATAAACLKHGLHKVS
jgi:hypothetical protein